MECWLNNESQETLGHCLSDFLIYFWEFPERMLLWGELLISKISSSFLNSGLCFTSDTATILCFIRPEASQTPLLYFPIYVRADASERCGIWSNLMVLKWTSYKLDEWIVWIWEVSHHFWKITNGWQPSLRLNDEMLWRRALHVIHTGILCSGVLV